jgi:hypothetical protein
MLCLESHSSRRRKHTSDTHTHTRGKHTYKHEHMNIHEGEEGRKRGGSAGGWFWARRWGSRSEDRDF